MSLCILLSISWGTACLWSVPGADTIHRWWQSRKSKGGGEEKMWKRMLKDRLLIMLAIHFIKMHWATISYQALWGAGIEMPTNTQAPLKSINDSTEIGLWMGWGWESGFWSKLSWEQGHIQEQFHYGLREKRRKSNH